MDFSIERVLLTILKRKVNVALDLAYMLEVAPEVHTCYERGQSTSKTMLQSRDEFILSNFCMDSARPIVR